MGSHQGTKLAGNGAFQLNRQVRNAESRIEHIRGDDRPGGADIDAGAAAAAVIAFGGIRFQIQIGQKRGEKIRAPFRMDDIGVFSKPADSRQGKPNISPSRGPYLRRI